MEHTAGVIQGTAEFMAELTHSTSRSTSRSTIMLEGSSAQLGLLCTLLPRLCWAVLLTTELSVAATAPCAGLGLQMAWASAMTAALPCTGALSYISRVCPTGNACTQFVLDSMGLVAVRLRLLAAAQHQRRSGRSCIPADALAAAVAAGTISGVQQQQQQQQQLLTVPGSREPMPPHLQATFQQQPPGPMTRALLPETVSKHIDAGTAELLVLAYSPREYEQRALVRSAYALPGYLVSLLQLLAKLAALEADSPAVVCSAVFLAHAAVQLCVCAGGDAPAGSSSSSSCIEIGRLTQAEVAVLLPTVLHLLSAAVLQALSCAAAPTPRQQPAAAVAASHDAPGTGLTGDYAARLARQFAGVVAPVVLSGAAGRFGGGTRVLAVGSCQGYDSA
jgi:hypothetical protein